MRFEWDFSTGGGLFDRSVRERRVMGAVFAAFGLAMIGGAVYLGHDLAAHASAPGRVVRVNSAYTVVEFEADGRSRTFPHRCPGCRGGERVEVLYDPAHPADAQVEDRSRWEGLYGLGAMGALFAAIGVLVIAFSAGGERRSEGARPGDAPARDAFAFLSWFFMLSGAAACAVAAYLVAGRLALLGRAETAAGTVVALERWNDLYHPVVRFEAADGGAMTFRSNAGARPAAYAVGERVEVLYEPARPADATIRSFGDLWGAAVLTGAIGGVQLSVGAGILLSRRQRARRAADLRRAGAPLRTDLLRVERSGAIEVQGVFPWRIVTQWRNPRTGEVLRFTSGSLWSDPTPHLASRRITVFVDRRDPDRYEMDLSFLPAGART